MQFKSIIAVLALAVAVTATPIEPAAVNLVARTDPPPGPTIGQTCSNGQSFFSKCTALGIPLTPATNNGGLVSLIQLALAAGIPVQCVVNGVNVLNFGGACCNYAGNGPTNVQNGLVNIQNIALLSCS